MGVINKIVGTHSQRELKRHNHTIEKILSLKPEMEKLTDDEMKAQTTEFRNRFQKGETLDDFINYAHGNLLKYICCKIQHAKEYNTILIGFIQYKYVLFI